MKLNKKQTKLLEEQIDEYFCMNTLGCKSTKISLINLYKGSHNKNLVSAIIQFDNSNELPFRDVIPLSVLKINYKKLLLL